MITTEGRNIVKRYIAGQIPNIADAIAFGVGSTAPAIGDTSLSYEVLRGRISSVNADLANDRLVFKTTIAPGAMKTIYEVGLFNGIGTTTASRTLNILGPGTLAWSNSTLDSANARANSQALRINYVASGTSNAELTGLAEDLSDFDNTSSVLVAFYATTNLSAVRVRMGTDSANYFEFLITSPTLNGYNIHRLSKGAATKTGNPSWDAINYIGIRPTATSGGAGAIYFDGIRFEVNPILSNSILVARTALVTPVQVDTAIPSDVEYSLEINFT